MANIEKRVRRRQKRQAILRVGRPYNCVLPYSASVHRYEKACAACKKQASSGY